MTRPGDRDPVHLDTSVLIRALVPGTPESHALRGWIRDRRTVEMSTVAWAEFLCGPEAGGLDEPVRELARRVVRRLVPLEADHAATAARLFNASGRRRGSLADALVAATALETGAELATGDRGDFEAFEALGLRLAPGVPRG